MRRIVWTEPAISDLGSIRAYIGQFNPSAAQRMAVRLIAAANSLDEFSERGRSIDASRRELTVIRPYLIRYRVAGETVFILRIRRAAQDQDWS